MQLQHYTYCILLFFNPISIKEIIVRKGTFSPVVSKDIDGPVDAREIVNLLSREKGMMMLDPNFSPLRPCLEEEETRSDVFADDTDVEKVRELILILLQTCF